MQLLSVVVDLQLHTDLEDFVLLVLEVLEVIQVYHLYLQQ